MLMMRAVNMIFFSFITLITYIFFINLDVDRVQIPSPSVKTHFCCGLILPLNDRVIHAAFLYAHVVLKYCFSMKTNPNQKCPVGKNIHHVLDKRLLEVQRAMEEKLSEMTLADVKKEIAAYT